MPRPSRSRLALFMSDVLVWLGQPRWQIILSEEEEGDDVLASTDFMEASSGRFVVSLYISEDLLQADTEKQRTTMVHEALHAIHVGIDRLVWGGYVKAQMRVQEHMDFVDMYHEQRELMVDQLSYSIANTAEIKKLCETDSARARLTLMATVEPAIAHFGCSEEGCESVVIDVSVPVRAILSEDGDVTFVVNDDDIDVQPFWDHSLAVHGPRVD